METIITQCINCKYQMNSDECHCSKYQNCKKPADVMDANKECSQFACGNEMSINIVMNGIDTRVKGGLWGAIVGDALGVPVEFQSRFFRDQDPVNEMRAYGTYEQPFGTWSDDSSMMLCLLESINEGLSYDKLSKKFIDFAENGYMTPYGSVFDIGKAVHRSVTNMKSGINPVECGGIAECDNGNGSLMRILPLVFYIKNKSEAEQIKIIEDVSSLTHRTLIAKFACIFYVKIGMFLFSGKDKVSAYNLAIDYVKNNLSASYSEVFPTYERLLSGSLLNADVDDIRSGGYVVDTLEASLWSFMTTTTYSDCVFKAINLGGDTDTIACIAGGLAGIHYGIQGIPNNWIQMLARKNYINGMINKFAEKI